MTVDLAKVAEGRRRLKAMQTPFEGGCLCGAVRYRCSAPPFWSSHCHCVACQKLAGGSFSTAFTVKAESVKILSGETLVFERKADTGHAVTTFRCKSCGTWLFAERAGRPEFKSIIASTLDAPATLPVISNVYVTEAAPWTVLDPNLVQFQRMPEDELPPPRG